MELLINNQVHQVDVEPEMPLLWVIRDMLDLKGTKYSCGIAQCGACTVHIDGEPVRSCVLPASAAVGKNITTIEGLATNAAPHPLQTAWIKHQVPQCGYCQSGQIMAAAALLENSAADRCRHQQRHEQHLPLRHLCPYPRRHPRCGRHRS